MKTILFLTFFLILGILATIAYKQYTLLHLSETVKTPLSHTQPYSLAIPPKASLKGTVRSFSGDVQWQSREATEAAMLLANIPVVQGEEFFTGEMGSVSITFPGIVDLEISSNTHVVFVQTLPDQIVLRQNSGEVVYTNRKNTPISIRISPLLIQQNKGSLTIEKDPETGFITLNVTQGSLKIGFNDSENISTVLDIAEGESYEFDPNTRTGEIL